MRFYLTFALVILLVSGCASSTRVATDSSTTIGGLGAGDRLGRSMAAIADEQDDSAVTTLDANDYN
jgi:hypothetical protein